MLISCSLVGKGLCEVSYCCSLDVSSISSTAGTICTINSDIKTEVRKDWLSCPCSWYVGTFLQFFCSSLKLHHHFILLQTPCQSTFHGNELGMSKNGSRLEGTTENLKKFCGKMKGFFLRLPSCSQLLRIHFPEILQMKVLQTLMTDLLALLGFAGLLTVLLIFLTSSLEDIRR